MKIITDSRLKRLSKWKVKLVCMTNLAFVRLNTHAKHNTIVKLVSICLPAKKLKAALKGIPSLANGLQRVKSVVLEKTLPIVTKTALIIRKKII